MPAAVIRGTQIIGAAGLFGALQADFLTMKGTYDAPIIIGTIRLWHDTTTDVLRVKRGSK